MNENKKGKRYKFPDSFILIIGHIRVCRHLPYRQTEGLIKATIGKSIPEDKRPPSYSQTCRRTNKLDIDINSSIDDDDVVIIAVDSTGIKVTNRGQWMQDKWNVKNKKGYLKIHVAVDITRKRILSLEVTSEEVHDGKMLSKLVDNASSSSAADEGNHVKGVLADGMYDSNNNFRYLSRNHIKSGIKTRSNSKVRSNNCHARNMSVVK